MSHGLNRSEVSLFGVQSDQWGIDASQYKTLIADKPYSEVSDKYSFIPTSRVLNVLADYGYFPSRVNESRTRIVEKQGSQKHMIRLRHSSVTTSQRDGEFAEIILTNSHCGSAAFKLMLGFWRLVCANGLIVGDTMESFRILHKGYTDQLVESSLKSITNYLPALTENVQGMKAIELSPPEQNAFAKSVVELAWDGSGYAVEPSQVLRARRYDDRSNDLWTTFNKAQENVIKGGVRQVRENGTRIRSREVTSIDRSVNLNRAMFTLAEEMRRIKAA